MSTGSGGHFKNAANRLRFRRTLSGRAKLNRKSKNRQGLFNKLRHKPRSDGYVARDGNKYWLTPPGLMAELQKEFRFDFDACPHPRPEGYDSLEDEWGNSTYVNPPFYGPTAWVSKAIAENQKGKTVVLVFPTDKWIHYLLRAGAELRSLGDVKWCCTRTKKPGKGIGRYTMAFILRGQKP